MTIQNAKFRSTSSLCVYMMMVIFALPLVFTSGCETVPSNAESGMPAKDVSVYNQYLPVKIDIMPLTEFAGSDDDYQLQVFLSLQDSFGSHIKAPAVFRFELYHYQPRSAKREGRRITIWGDIDLTDSAQNNNYWQDFLRAYQFQLPLESKDIQASILQVTAIQPNGKRLTADMLLKAR
ncbi:hypothetical protein ACFL3G_08910 [Planctomycetota bacterium]